MTIWFPNIDWTVITSIAQVLGVIATFSAVIVALNISKPHVKLKAIFGQAPDTKKWSLVISAVNVSNIPIRITFIGMSFRRGIKSIRPITAEKILTSGENIDEVYSLSELKKILTAQIQVGHAKKSNRIRIYVCDPSKYYYKRTRYTIEEVLAKNDL